MKHSNYLILLFMWCTVLHSFSDKSFMAYRSQGFNLARNNSGWLQRCTEDNASISIEYSQSFDEQAISNYYFDCDELIFSGSRVDNRGEKDILADYFGLPTDFKSSLSFSPRIKNVIADFDFYWLLGCNDNGFNLRINIPITHTKWELNPCENVLATGSLDYPAGYMSNEIIERAQLPKGALEVLSGETTFGDLTLPLQFGRISPCAQSLTKFSDILVALGYTIMCNPKGMLAIDFHVIIPTGTRSHAINIFEPQIGNGHHWALGGSFAARYDIITNESDDFKLSAHVDTYIQHLFKTTQKRSYDLTPNGAGSRYILLMDMVNNVSPAQNFSPTIGQDVLKKQYITDLAYAIDATTLDSTIKINVQADLITKISARYRHFNFELGYNLWTRSPEKLLCREPLQHKFYSVKGDAQIYGFLAIGVDLPLPVNATQSKATLHAPQGNGNTTNNFNNSNADNANLMYNFGMQIVQTTPGSLSNTGATSIVQINGSNTAIVLSDDDINECSGLSPRAISRKIFGSASYGFETAHTQPYILIGAEGEFAGKDNCIKTAISQWGIWIKGGFNY